MQIIGTAKCKDTKKCRLWFDQRALSYNFVDFIKKPLSPGELKNIASGRSWDDLIDRNSKAWEKRQLAWKDYDPQQEVSECQQLLITPIVREGADVAIGYDPDSWERIARTMRG